YGHAVVIGDTAHIVGGASFCGIKTHSTFTQEGGCGELAPLPFELQTYFSMVIPFDRHIVQIEWKVERRERIARSQLHPHTRCYSMVSGEWSDWGIDKSIGRQGPKAGCVCRLGPSSALMICSDRSGGISTSVIEVDLPPGDETASLERDL
ncbi:hypothetical protein KIPB_010797, partial [Kipferlia bialata]